MRYNLRRINLVIKTDHVRSRMRRFASFLPMDLREQFRIFYVISGIFVGSILMLIILHLVQVRQIELVVDGHREMVRATNTATIERFLARQGIELSPYDRVSAPLTDRVRNHDRVEVKRAIPVTLEADDQILELQTSADHVAELLRQADVKLGVWDIVEPGLDARVHSGDHIRVIRVTKQIVYETEILPFDIVTRDDKSISRGKEVVLQEGQDGLVEHKIERVFRDGKLYEERILESHTKRDVTDRIIAQGTRSDVAILSASSPNIQTVTKEGLTFGVKKIIEATLTAYDAGPVSTGKTEDHPEYGITYTGTRVEEGRTVAVDPTVIPFGWWIYIDGYGFRRAEDKGSAIKGNKVDIYFDSYEEAVTFGRKKGKVYIIGPEHPGGQ